MRIAAGSIINKIKSGPGQIKLSVCVVSIDMAIIIATINSDDKQLRHPFSYRGVTENKVDKMIISPSIHLADLHNIVK